MNQGNLILIYVMLDSTILTTCFIELNYRNTFISLLGHLLLKVQHGEHCNITPLDIVEPAWTGQSHPYQTSEAY